MIVTIVTHSSRLISNATCFGKLSPFAPLRVKIHHYYVISKNFNSMYFLIIILPNHSRIYLLSVFSVWGITLGIGHMAVSKYSVRTFNPVGDPHGKTYEYKGDQATLRRGLLMTPQGIRKVTCEEGRPEFEFLSQQWLPPSSVLSKVFNVFGLMRTHHQMALIWTREVHILITKCHN